MKLFSHRITTMIAMSCLALSCQQQNTNYTSGMKISHYPETEQHDTILNFFGTEVHDPYMWLENDTSRETMDWVKRENELTRKYIDSIPFRNTIKQRYTDLMNFEKTGMPSKVGGYFFFTKNSGLEPQGKIMVRKGLEGTDEVFIDVNSLSADGTTAANLLGASDDDKFMAVAINAAGSDWSSIVVYDIENRKRLNDELKWVKFSGATWYKDGFYYSRYPQPAKGEELSGNNQNHMIYYHRLGTTQEEDVLVYENKNRPDVYNAVSITEDKKFLFLTISPGTDGYEIWYKHPEDRGSFRPLFTDLRFHTSPVESTEDGKLLVQTDVDAPRYRLVLVDPENPQEENWKEIIPQNEHLLQGVSTCGGQVFASYLENASTKVYRSNYDGSGKIEIVFPDKTGSGGGFYGKKNDKFCFYSFTSFTYPGLSFRYDLETGKSEIFSKLNVKFNPEDYESKQVKYKSKDGTEIPMFIVHKKGIKLDGNNPCLLYGYGGFNVPLTPGFSTSRLILLEKGGVFAMPNLRGGGEFGEEWHKAGMLENKQNVFDDFIAAAEYLIAQGYSNSKILAIEGGSNGGLLVGACMTQRPDLFQVAFPAVGVMDMLRFHLFTVGKGWIPEYGCADSSKAQFDNLYRYSPYHNLKEGTNYPATLVMTADHDDRVVPAHSFKFAARLQQYHRGERPVLIRVEKSAGHGAGKSTEQIIEEQSDKWSFFFDQTIHAY
jgi:prolyl oligopeptidase